MSDSGYYVYLLLCGDNSLYCGTTNDLEKRLKIHNSGKGAKYTRCRLPVKMVWSTKTADKSQALKLEYSIKQLSREEKLKLISSTIS